MPVVDLQDVSVRYGTTVATTGVTFSAAAGETVALVGANGAGKTSTVNAALGLIEPAQGSVRVFGADPRRRRAVIALRWGVMPQTGGLPMGLTAGESVQLFADLYGRGADAPETLQMCGIAAVAHRRWRQLSGGQQQRLSLAIALVGGSDLLVLDEPTAALDVEGQEQVIEVLRGRAQAGSTVLMTSHRFDEVERVADRVVVLHRGTVVCNDTVASLTQARPQIRLRGISPEHTAALDVAVGTRFVASGGEIVSPVSGGTDPHRQLSEVLQWCEARGLTATAASVGNTSLVDIYRELVTE